MGQAMTQTSSIDDARYLDRCTNVVEHDRHIYCGMAQALDDGIGQITTMLT